ncbi:HNH endonuclease [Desulfacinum hydrothermale DSM 13146]|uniref:HNH endonuclease n=1 Tax=Desulfacinum hydrothermale DSM 13146 TaxID=1121390 RepID=A0A1W1XSW1_9BACT|nr:HNH endonuclease signature motif containing protein [Desulfacinum hydrothermale]SMC26932.1 HNH endonuclease [Desulfacinum hydrothermale DSM 13146]
MIEGMAGSGFLVEVPPGHVRKEKEKARALRKTQWWQRRIAKGRCHYCGARVDPKDLTMDHVVPLVRGGRTTKGNVVPCCKDCNSKKKYYLPIEWEEYLRTLQAPAQKGE